MLNAETRMEGKIKFYMINLYATNKDYPEFYESIYTMISSKCDENHLILIGDFHLVLDVGK